MWAKQVWYKDGQLQTYTSHWEPVGPAPEPVAVTGVSLDQSSLTLWIDETEKLTATISPSNASDKKVTWSSSNDEIATVSSNGTVRWVSVGNVTITVTTHDGNFTDTCSVTVSNGQHEVQEVLLAGYSAEDTIYLIANRTNGFPIQVTPYTASNIAVEVTSGDSSTMEVGPIYYDDQPTEWSVGGVTLIWVNAWNTTVTVRSVENPDAYATYNIIVQEDVPVQSISNLSSATGDAYKYEAGGDTRGIATFDYYPTDAVRPQEDVRMSLKEGETSVWYGWIQQGNEAWVAQINFQVDSSAQVGDSAVYEIICDEPEPTRWAKSRSVPLEIEITVWEWVTGLNDLSLEGLEIQVGQTDTSKTFTYYPSNAEFDSIKVESNNPGWFTARAVKDSDGVGHIEVTALQPGGGSVNIQCGNWYSNVFSVYVPEPQVIEVESLTNPSVNSLTIPLGEYRIVSWDPYPSDANAFDNVQWVVSSPNIYIDNTYFSGWYLMINVMWSSVWSGLINCLINWQDQWYSISVDIVDATTDVETLSNQTTSSFTGEVGQTNTVTYTTWPEGANRCVVDRAISDSNVIQLYDQSFSAWLQQYTATFQFIGAWSAVIKPYIDGVQQWENPISVTVTEPQPQASLTIDTSNMSVEEWQTANRSFTYTPTDADFNDITINNDYPSVATASLVKDSDGNGHVEVIWVSTGGTTIEISYAGNTYSFYVSVTTPVIPVHIGQFSSATLNLLTGQTAWLTFNYTPSNANDSSNVSCVFSDPTVAQMTSISLNPGYSWFMYFEWLSAGTTTVDVQEDGVSTWIVLTITVTDPVLLSVSFQTWYQQPGSVDIPQITDIPVWTPVTINGNEVTINWTTVTATPDAWNHFSHWLDWNWNTPPSTITDNMGFYAYFEAD